METREINYLLKKLCPCQFVGVFAADQVPTKPPLLTSDLKKCYVLNTDKSTEPGSHWVCVVFQPHEKPVYFDSYGLKPFVSSIESFLGLDYDFNSTQLQHPLSTTCGEWCILFILCYLSGHSLKCILNLFENSPDLLLNDYAVNKFVNKISGKRRHVINKKFLREQIARSMRENLTLKIK